MSVETEPCPICRRNQGIPLSVVFTKNRLRAFVCQACAFVWQEEEDDDAK